LKAIILSAGKGFRLKSLEQNLPKGLVPINGKPMLEIIIDDLKSIGFTEILIVVGYKSDDIIQYFGDGAKFGITITYATQEKQIGTANALLQAKSFVENDPFLVHLGDAINPNALKNIFIKMLESKSEISILVSPIKNSRNKLVGNIEIENNHVVRIAEKTSIKNANFFWAGVAFFKNNKIFQKLTLLKPSHTGEFEITDALNELLLDDIIMDSHICEKSIDAGTITGIEESSNLLDV